MESGVQQRTASTKRSKSKKKPIKVVYISNPMKVKATASEFRALVQELTGKYAELPPDLSRFHLDGDGHQTDSDNSSAVTKSDDYTHSTHAVVMPDQAEEANDLGKVIGSSMVEEAFDDDVFTPEFMDNISPFFPPPTIFYQSPQLDDLLTSFHEAALYSN